MRFEIAQPTANPIILNMFWMECSKMVSWTVLLTKQRFPTEAVKKWN